MGLATVAGELGLALSKQAREAASEAANEGLEFADEKTAPIRARASRMAGTAGEQARDAGLAIIDLASRVARLRR